MKFGGPTLGMESTLLNLATTKSGDLMPRLLLMLLHLMISLRMCGRIFRVLKFCKKLRFLCGKLATMAYMLKIICRKGEFLILWSVLFVVVRWKLLNMHHCYVLGQGLFGLVCNSNARLLLLG